MNFLPVVIKGESNTQLTAIAALVRSMPQRVQPSLLPLLCTVITSKRASEKMVYSSAVPKPRKWQSAGKAGSRVGTLKYELTPDKYEVSLEIDGDAYDDDEINLYAPLAQQLAQSLVLFPDELISTVLVAGGEAGACFDGANFYAATHKWPEGENKTAQKNLQTGTGVTADKVQDDFYTALAAMQGWLDDRKRLMIPQEELQGSDALVVQHAPALNSVMDSVFGVDKNGAPYDISSGVKSKLSGRAATRSDGYLTGNSWYLHSIRGVDGQKPLTYIDREAASVTVLGRGTEHFTKNGTILMTGRCRFGMGYGHPSRSQKIKN